jgi:predicted amidophosphoribosyltransferase
MKLSKVDSRLFLLGEHCFLDSSDECYFANLYDSPCQPAIKPFIILLKQGNETAILAAVKELALALPHDWIQQYTFVPMPPSRGDKDSVRAIVQKLPVADARVLLVQKENTRSSHQGWRPTPIHRSRFMRLNEAETEPKPGTIVVVDDVLATGSHFRSAKMVVRERWPNIRVMGVFLARARLHRYTVLPQVGYSRVGIFG